MRLNPSCELDQKSAELIQEQLRQLNRNARTAKNRARAIRAQLPKSQGAASMAYLSGVQDATRFLLNRLQLDIEFTREGTFTEEYLSDESLQQLTFGPDGI